MFWMFHKMFNLKFCVNIFFSRVITWWEGFDLIRKGFPKFSIHTLALDRVSRPFVGVGNSYTVPDVEGSNPK